MSHIDELLKKRQQMEVPAKEEEQTVENRYFSILGNAQQNDLELIFRSGQHSAFPYQSLAWYNWDPESGCLDAEFGAFLVTIKGRGLLPLFKGILNRRAAWIREASDPIDEATAKDCYIEEIAITPPKGFSDEESEG